MRAAAAAGARRVVHTSTIDVFHAERGTRLRRVGGRRLPEGHGLRALEAARRGAGARRGGRDRHRARDRQPGRGLRARAAAAASTRSRPACFARWSRAAAARCRCCRPAVCRMVYSTGLATGQLLAAARGVPGRALHPLRRPHELPRAGRDRRAPGRPRAGAAVMPVPVAKAISAAGEAVARVIRQAAAAAQGAAPLLPLGRPPAVRQGAARARLGADAARGGPEGGGGDVWLRSAGPSRRTSRPSPGCSTTAPPTCTTASPAAATAPCACLERSLAEPGNASSADVVWVAEVDGRVAAAMAAFPVDEAAAALAPPSCGSPCATRRPGAGRTALLLYWLGGRAAPSPPAPAFYVDALATRPAFRRRGAARALLAEAERQARDARAAGGGAGHHDHQRAARAPCTRARGSTRWPTARRAAGCPGFVALVKPLR